MKKLALAASLLSTFALSSCDKAGGGSKIPKNRDLKAGGVYVSYNLGCEAGCDQINKGDLIQKVDGKDVKTADDVGNLADNKPHKL